jgi:hypothetical protein
MSFSTWRTSWKPWSATLSHETLELIGDPENNMFVAGPILRIIGDGVSIGLSVRRGAG